MDLLQYLPTALPIITGLIASVFTYYASKKKDNRDDFATLAAANEKFRNEVRADLKVAKEELQAAKLRISYLETELDQKNDLVNKLQSEISSLQSQIKTLQRYNVQKESSL